MIHEQIAQIEARIQQAENVPPETKAELLNLLSNLRSQVELLSETNTEDAHSVSGFAAASAHEATRTEKKPELLESALGGLTGSVGGLETSHPKLVEVVNQIATALSNMGI